MADIDELTKAYITAGENLHEAEAALEKAFNQAKDSLPERIIYKKAEADLSKAVEN